MPRLPEPLPVDLESLLPAAVRMVVRCQDPDRFRDWLAEHLHGYLTPGALEPPQLRLVAFALGTSIWNATPLPGHQFRPRPVPRAGRNDPCPCGSGRKLKRCCGDLPDFPGMADRIWPLALDAFDKDDLDRAVEQGRVPIAVLEPYADALFEAGRPQATVALLERLFSGNLDRRGSDLHAVALDLLAAAHDALGNQEAKRDLLEGVVVRARRSPMRTTAWQLLAAVRMDDGEPGSAWEAFEQARRAEPDAPTLAQLEVLLLVADGRGDEVPARARDWVGRLRRDYEDVDDLVDWLHQAAEDPDSLMSDSSADDEVLIRAWLEEVTGRPLPSYVVSDTPGEGDPSVQLAALGFPAAEIDAVLARIEQRPALEVDEPEQGGGSGATPVHALVAPDSLRGVEGSWHAVFPCQKPFSVQEQPFGDDDPWDCEDDWMGFLAENPQAFDSLDILDDVATAMQTHPAAEEASFNDDLLGPVLERAVAILERALADVAVPNLAWGVPGNRPALRSLVRLGFWHMGWGDTSRGFEMCERALVLNPQDDHGVRTTVMDWYLRVGRDDDALTLANEFPQDMFAETIYGKVLALYRLDRIEAARDALRDAVERLPKVAPYLVRKRVRKPALAQYDPQSTGGDDQAWFYRVTMRPIWQKTPGVLEWLEQAAGD